MQHKTVHSETQTLKKTSVSAVREKPKCKSSAEGCCVISIRVSLLHIQTSYGIHPLEFVKFKKLKAEKSALGESAQNVQGKFVFFN